MVSDRASSVTTFSDWFVRSITQKVGISDSGMATAAIRVARQSRRKIKTTAIASRAPSTRVSTEAWKLLTTSSVVLATSSMATSPRSWSSFSISALTRS